MKAHTLNQNDIKISILIITTISEKTTFSLGSRFEKNIPTNSIRSFSFIFEFFDKLDKTHKSHNQLGGASLNPFHENKSEN